MKKVLASLDTEVTVDELEIGDWIEYNGEHKRVGTLFTEDPNTISLKELRFLDRFTKIKKLGSKGRNLRAQNIKVTIDNKGIQKLPTKFDQWDLDSVLFNHYTEYFVDNYDSILANPKDVFNATLIHSFEDLKNFVKTIYPESENLDDIVRKKDKVLLRRYGRMLIDRDMKALKEGKFKIPFRFKETLNLSNDIADIISSEYKANECAVGKPFANKFLLEEGDSLNDVSVTFFENKLKRREISSWTNNYYDVFLKSIHGYEVHFSNVESIYQSPLLWSLCLNISHKIGTSNQKTNLFRHASLCQIYCDSHILSRRLSCCNEHKPFVRSICFVCSKYFSTHSYFRG